MKLAAINSLIKLADKLDSLGLKQDVNFLDEVIGKQADMAVPVMRNLTQIPEDYEIISPVMSYADDSPKSRLDLIKERYKLMKLKKMKEEPIEFRNLETFEDEELPEESKIEYVEFSPAYYSLTDLIKNLTNKLIEVETGKNKNIDVGKIAETLENTALSISTSDDLTNEEKAELYNLIDKAVSRPRIANNADDELLKKEFDEDEHGTLEKVMDFLKANPEILSKLLLFLV